MLKQPNLFPLKLLVISLGILLIGGTIFVFAAIASTGKELAAHSCADATFSLQGKKFIAVSVQGEHIQLTLSTPPKTQVLTLDRCSGKLLQTFTIEP